MFGFEAAHDPFVEAAPVEFEVEIPQELWALVEKYEGSHKAIWLSETGVREENGQADWFYFWWSKPVADDAEWGMPDGRGNGWACDGPVKFRVNYEPDHKGKLH